MVWPNETDTQFTYPLSIYLYLQVFICQESLAWFEGYGFYSPANAWPPPGYPVVGLCCGDLIALGLQVRSLHRLQQITDGVNIGGGPTHNLDSGPG